MYKEQRRTIGWVSSILRGRVMPFSRMALGVSAAAGLSLFITFCSSGRCSSVLRRAVLRFRMTEWLVSVFQTNRPAVRRTATISTTHISHRHPALCAMKPPQIGPRIGPKRMPMEYIATALPRCDATKRSAMTPVPMVMHALPPTPARKRIAIKPPRFGASAQPSVKAQKKTLLMFRMMQRP